MSVGGWSEGMGQTNSHIRSTKEMNRHASKRGGAPLRALVAGRAGHRVAPSAHGSDVRMIAINVMRLRARVQVLTPNWAVQASRLNVLLLGCSTDIGKP